MSSLAQDLKRAALRGALVATPTTAYLAFAAVNWYPRPIPPPFLYRLGDLIGDDRLNVRPGQAAIYGLLVSLVVVPLALVELARARKARSVGTDGATAVTVFFGAALLIALAAVQAIYTTAMLDGRSGASAIRAVSARVFEGDAFGDAIVCFAGAVPLAVTTILRILGYGLPVQSLFSSGFTFMFAGPVLLLLSFGSDGSAPVFALGCWIFGVAALLGPLASLADRLAGEETVEESPT